MPYDNRVSEMLSWLDLPPARRPSMVSVYFEEPDSTGHRVGPDHPDVIREVERIDRITGDIVKCVCAVFFCSYQNAVKGAESTSMTIHCIDTAHLI